MSQRPPGSFTQATAPALPTSLSPLRGKRFQAWLRQQYYERTWDAPSPAALNAALNVLEAQAQFDGPQRKVSVRPAEQDGLIYLDLADEYWRCIEIGPNGWRIAEDPPVRFRRSAGMQPLPLPERGGFTTPSSSKSRDRAIGSAGTPTSCLSTPAQKPPSTRWIGTRNPSGMRCPNLAIAAFSVADRQQPPKRPYLQRILVIP
jgi:hypothetical protein